MLFSCQWIIHHERHGSICHVDHPKILETQVEQHGRWGRLLSSLAWLKRVATLLPPAAIDNNRKVVLITIFVLLQSFFFFQITIAFSGPGWSIVIFCQFEAEIFLWLFLDDRENYLCLTMSRGIKYTAWSQDVYHVTMWPHS